MNLFNIKKIKIKNFRSIQKTVELEIKPGLYTIEGINLDEAPGTNGAGKSTIVSALYWCLTGNALTNEVLADEVVNITKGKNCRVSVDIEYNGDEIQIIRYRKDSEFGNTVELFINGQNLTCHKITDTQNRINQLIRIPFELLHSTVIMTGDIQSAFSSLTPQQRVQTLENIRDYSIWNDVRNEANKDIKNYNKELSEIREKIQYENGQITVLTEMSTQTDIKLQSEASFNQELLNSQNISCKQENIKLEASILAAETTKKNLDDEIEALDDSKMNSEMIQIMNSANELKSKVSSLEQKIKQSQYEISIIDKWFASDKCPTCGKPLDRTSEQINIKSVAKQNFSKNIKETQTIILRYTEEIDAKRLKWAEINKNFSQISDKRRKILTEKNKIDDEILNINRKISQNDQMVQLNKTKLDNHNSNLEILNRNLKEYTLKIDTCKKKILELNTKSKQINYKKQLSEYYYKLLGSKGELRPYLLKKDIIYLNDIIQKYIDRFFKNTSVSLQLNGAAIDICIDSNGVKKSVSSLSGGEKKRLDIAIQLGLYDLLKTTLQLSFNVLFLDEIETKLDPLGCQQLIEIIEDKFDGTETVFWITNNDMVKENIVNKIICKKALGITTLEQI